MGLEIEAIALLKELYIQIRNQPASLLSGKFDATAFADKPGGNDTLAIDALAEGFITGNAAALKKFNIDFQETGLHDYLKQGAIITEESGLTGKIDVNSPVLISDPIDLSKEFSKMSSLARDYDTVGQVIDEYKKGKESHPSSSLTLIADGRIAFASVLDLYSGLIDSVVDGQAVESQLIAGNKIVTLQNDGDYSFNLHATGLDSFELTSLAPLPGPLRYTLLARDDVGGVAYNGEKIQESLPAVAMTLGRPDLSVLKLTGGNVRRYGWPMAPSQEQSIYGSDRINLLPLFNDNPSACRDSLLIVPTEKVAFCGLPHYVLT